MKIMVTASMNLRSHTSNDEMLWNSESDQPITIRAYNCGATMISGY